MAPSRAHDYMLPARVLVVRIKRKRFRYGGDPSTNNGVLPHHEYQQFHHSPSRQGRRGFGRGRQAWPANQGRGCGQWADHDARFVGVFTHTYFSA
jgi:hypothetical protein